MDFTKTLVALGSSIGAREMLKAASSIGLNDALGMVGLERRPSALSRWLPALGLVTLSAAVGAGVALLLAPSSGTQLRARLSDGIDDAKRRLSPGVDHTQTNPSHRHAVS